MRKTPRFKIRFVVLPALCLFAVFLVLNFRLTRAPNIEPPPPSAAPAAPPKSLAPDRSPPSPSRPSAAPEPVPASPAASVPREQPVPAAPPQSVPGKIAHDQPVPSSALPAPPASDDDLIEQSLARLKNGNLAYNTPGKMKSGSTAHVTARIGSDQISRQTLESGMPADRGTKTEIEATPVSTKMKMTLKGADFDITPLSSEEQIVGGGSPTEWEWDVVPRHAGTLRLHMAAVVELKNLSRDFTTVDRDIAVQVDPVGAVTKFVETNTVWILGTLGACGTALWAWWKRRKKAKVPAWQVP